MTDKSAKSFVGEKFKVHKMSTIYYIGPVHGRNSIAEYETKQEAQAALRMYNWLMEIPKIKKLYIK